MTALLFRHSMMNECLSCARKVGFLTHSLTMEAKDNGGLSPHSTTKQYVKIHNMSQGGGITTRRRQLTFAHLYLSPASLSRCPQQNHTDYPVMSQEQGSFEKQVTNRPQHSNQKMME